MKNDSFHKKQGSALVVVLWAVLILAFAVSMASERIALILGDASTRMKRFQAALLADSAIASLEGILKEEQRKVLDAKRSGDLVKRPLDLSRFQGIWQSQSSEFGGGSFWIELEDEQSKINWVKTPPSIWRNLFEKAGVPTERVDAWLDALSDWQDPDDTRAINGAETADYQALKENRRRAKNAPVTDMGELPWIMGGPDMMRLNVAVDLQGQSAPLLPMTTIYGDGKININTAPAVLIAAALNIPMESAAMVVRSRWGPDGIEGTTDDVFLDGLPAGVTSGVKDSKNSQRGQKTASGAITTSSKIFRVRGVGQFQGQRVVREALAARDSEIGLRLLQEPRTVDERRVFSLNP